MEFSLIHERFIGTTNDTDDETLIAIGESEGNIYEYIHQWCEAIDKTIVLIREKAGIHTRGEQELWKHRAFNYREYSYLWNDSIKEIDFLRYPVYKYLNIHSKIKLSSIRQIYQYSEDDYIRCVLDHSSSELLSFFRNKTVKVAKLSESKLRAGILMVAPSRKGKTILTATILHDLFRRWKGRSFIVIDPHRTLADMISRFDLPKERVVHFSLKYYESDKKIASFNVFDHKNLDDLSLNNVIEQIIHAISEIPVSESVKIPEFTQDILEKCLMFLFKTRKNPKLEHLHELLSLEPVMLGLAQEYSDYFSTVFMKEGSSREAGRRRVGRAIRDNISKAILSSHTSIHLENLMNSNKIIIFDLEGLGRYTQMALGKFVIANAINYAMKRSSQTDHGTVLCVDESDLFVTKGFVEVATKTNKYGLHPFFITQSYELFKEHYSTIKSNCAVRIVAGDSSEFVNKVVDMIPDVIHRKNVNGNNSRLLNMKNYTFIMQSDGHVEVFKSISKLVNSNRFYRSKEKQDEFKQYQLDKYYKDIEVTQMQEQQEIIGELAPIKPFFNNASIPPIKPLNHRKDRAMLYALARHKYLTQQQLVYLKISGRVNNLPHDRLLKQKYIGETYMQNPNGSNNNLKVYYLTKAGANLVKEDNISIHVNFPTTRPKNLLPNALHKFVVVNHAIEYYRYKPKFLLTDIDNSGKRNYKATRIDFYQEFCEPDMIFQIGDQIYTFECENGIDTEKSVKKFNLEWRLLKSQALNKKFDNNREVLCLMSFESETVMKGVMEKADDRLVNRFLFKLHDDHWYNGWRDMNYNQRSLF